MKRIILKVKNLQKYIANDKEDFLKNGTFENMFTRPIMEIQDNY